MECLLGIVWKILFLKPETKLDPVDAVKPFYHPEKIWSVSSIFRIKLVYKDIIYEKVISKHCSSSGHMELRLASGQLCRAIKIFIQQGQENGRTVRTGRRAETDDAQVTV